MANHREAERRAAAFLARHDSGDWSTEDDSELECWLSESTVHRVAYLRLEATWEEARRLKALAAGLPPGQVPDPSEWRHSPFFERSPVNDRAEEASPRRTISRRPSRGSWARRLAVAAGLTAVVAGAALYYWLNQPGEVYRTEIGAVTNVPLKDGSTITLNTASEVLVDLKPDERHVRLDAGEAFFTVAKDPRRPFVVEAGNKRIIAVGTAFSVRRMGNDIRVAVTEGRVRVENHESPEAIAKPQRLSSSPAEIGSSTGSAEPVLLPAGTVASASDAGVVIEQQSVSQMEDGLSWREGYLTFHDESLADAVAEFNRYNSQQIVIADPAVASIRISGTFRAVNHEAFVRVLGEGFGIHSGTDGDHTVLTRD